MLSNRKISVFSLALTCLFLTLLTSLGCPQHDGNRDSHTVGYLTLNLSDVQHTSSSGTAFDTTDIDIAVTWANNTADTVYWACSQIPRLPSDFSSWLNFEISFQNSTTDNQIFYLQMEGVADDEVHSSSLVWDNETSATALSIVAGDLIRTDPAVPSGTYSPRDHLHVAISRPQASLGVIRMYTLTLKYRKRAE